MTTLNVYYKLRRDDMGHAMWQDVAIEKLVGSEAIGSGIFIPTSERDLQFDLTEAEAKAAMTKLRQAGFKCSVSEI